MTTGIKTLSLDAIKSSSDIEFWLRQFPSHQQTTAQLLLSRLWFVDRDIYSEWIKRELSQLPAEQNHAVYAIRKLEGEVSYWQQDGTPVSRPAQSLGSEDLVSSIISNAHRVSQGTLFDHPSLSDLKKARIRSFILIDDSIGSGQRVVEFINAMLEHKQFMSWWSLGWVRITVMSFARTYSAERYIVDNVRGSNHSLRTIPKSKKISFKSRLRYDAGWLESRWGTGFQTIVDFCHSFAAVPRSLQCGFGDVMGNLIFYHSVPDNIPGMLWSDTEGGLPLFPNRGLPGWMVDLLEKPTIGPSITTTTGGPDKDLLGLIALLKSGVRKSHSLSLRMSCDILFVSDLIKRAQQCGLVTDNRRPSRAGLDFYYKNSRSANVVAAYDYSMYIPTSWSAG